MGGLVFSERVCLFFLFSFELFLGVNGLSLRSDLKFHPIIFFMFIKHLKYFVEILSGLTIFCLIPENFSTIKKSMAKT